MYILTITFAKLLKLFIQFFRLGAGYTWAGHLALDVYPSILKEARLIPHKGVIFISGTNGKTTTTKMIAHVLRKNGFKVTTNDTGANLLNGITSSLVLDTSLLGVAKSDIGVFEVDEFNLPFLLEAINPNVLVLLNLSRDQLDRYGETDIILERWVNSVKKLPKSTELLINSTQPRFNEISNVFKADTHLFNGSSSEAAIKVASFFNIVREDALVSLSDFSPAWGRGESIKHGSFTWHVHLAKNPASFDTNLDAISADTYLLILNDEIPDGRDVSWIYDISSEKIYNSCKGKEVYISGSRAFDMAVRLQYAGVSIDNGKVTPDIQGAVLSVENASKTHDITVFANYSAMLSLRKVLLGRRIL